MRRSSVRRIPVPSSGWRRTTSSNTRDRAQPGSGLQHGHHHGVENLAERIRPPTAAERFVGRGQSRGPGDPMPGRLAHRRLGGRDGHGVGLTVLHEEPHLVIGHVAAGHEDLPSRRGRAPHCRPVAITIPVPRGAVSAVPFPSVELRSPSRNGTAASLILIDAKSHPDRRATLIGRRATHQGGWRGVRRASPCRLEHGRFQTLGSHRAPHAGRMGGVQPTARRPLSRASPRLGVCRPFAPRSGGLRLSHRLACVLWHPDGLSELPRGAPGTGSRCWVGACPGSLQPPRRGVGPTPVLSKNGNERCVPEGADRRHWRWHVRRVAASMRAWRAWASGGLLGVLDLGWKSGRPCRDFGLARAHPSRPGARGPLCGRSTVTCSL